MKVFIGILISVFLNFIPVTQANTITVTLGLRSFTPDTINAVVGDTVKWQWTTAIHTTTSTVIPAGALPWNAPLDSAHTTFSYRLTTVGAYQYQCSYHYIFGMTGLIMVNPNAIEPISGTVPAKFELFQNYPNPFNPSTHIAFDVAEPSFVKMFVYDLTGAMVAILANEELRQGSYNVVWDAANNPSGTYFIQISTDKGFRKTIKLALVK